VLWNLSTNEASSYAQPSPLQTQVDLPIVPLEGARLPDTAVLRVCLVPAFVPDAPTVFIKNYPAFLRAAKVGASRV
jgi:hypothetical protein